MNEFPKQRLLHTITAITTTTTTIIIIVIILVPGHTE